MHIDNKLDIDEALRFYDRLRYGEPEEEIQGNRAQRRKAIKDMKKKPNKKKRRKK